MTSDEYADKLSVTHRFHGDIYIGETCYSTITEAVRAAFLAGQAQPAPVNARLLAALKDAMVVTRNYYAQAISRADLEAHQAQWGAAIREAEAAQEKP